MRATAALLASVLATSATAGAAAPVRTSPHLAALDQALSRLAADGAFSGAVVIRGADGVKFARGYGLADPFGGRRFTPDTPVDSASLAKPVTAAAVLLLAQQGKIDLDQPVTLYLPEFPYAPATVRHLLSHSAGVPGYGAVEPLDRKSNRDLLVEIGARRIPPLFQPGSRFTYCNLCYTTLALLIERVSGRHYLDYARTSLSLPGGVTIRPQALADWKRRAIGYSRSADGSLKRADSYEGEAFYGTGNLSITANQLARWGAEWWSPKLAPVRSAATTTAQIDGKPSGLTLGSWYCAKAGQRCHYLGHHEGFHHMLYWDAGRRVSLAMVTNNTLAPKLQQRLQRALVAFAESRPADARRELAQPLPEREAKPGSYRTPSGEEIVVAAASGPVQSVTRGGLAYPAYPIGTGIRYAPGLDAYSASSGDRLRLLSLYEDITALPAKP